MAHQILIRIGMNIEKNLGGEKAKDFMAKYPYLIRERDTSDLWRQFAIWLLVDEDHGVLRFTNPGTPQYEAIQQVAQLYINDCKDADAWKAAKDAAWSAASYDAAWSAASYAAWSAAKAAYYASYAAYFAYASGSAADATATAAAAAADAADPAAHYQLMADKLIELLQAAPMIHETQRTHCKTIANKLGDLINKQESMVDNMDNRGETVMDNSDKISFSISHHNGTKHITLGKQGIEKHVRQIEYALSVVKALLKDNPSDAISINVGMVDGTISVTYPSK